MYSYVYYKYPGTATYYLIAASDMYQLFLPPLFLYSLTEKGSGFEACVKTHREIFGGGGGNVVKYV